MAQRDTIKRQQLLINYLRTRSRTYDEIEFHFENESSIQGYNYNISKRTFQRDIKDVEELYGVEIRFSRTEMKYLIVNEEKDIRTERMMEAFDVFNTLNLADKISEYIHFENRITSGSHYILDILTAIKNRNLIEVVHQKYWEDKSTIRSLEPYAVKEYRYRWYLIAKDLKDNRIKSFGLDRILSIISTKDIYFYPTSFNVEEYFKYSYGVIGANGQKPSKVILSFTPFQGKYIKSLPLHYSQKTLVDNDQEYKIELELIITLDFIMDLQYYAGDVKVIKPGFLAKEIKKAHKNALNLY